MGHGPPAASGGGEKGTERRGCGWGRGKRRRRRRRRRRGKTEEELRGGGGRLGAAPQTSNLSQQVLKETNNSTHSSRCDS